MKYIFKKLLSSFSFNFPRTLVYMIQACEYDFKLYLKWLPRVKDFSSVEKRGKLIKTPKSSLILFTTWIIWLSSIVFFLIPLIRAIFINFEPQLIILIIILAFILIPAFTSQFFLLPVWLIKIIELPIIYFIDIKTNKILSKHKGIKIGIAGSFGKTSMREILKTVISEGKKVAAPPDSYNTPLGISKFVKTLKGDEDVIIFELGEYYPGDIKRLCRIVEPHIGIITGVNEAHLTKFKTLEKTKVTIFELSEYLGDVSLVVEERLVDTAPELSEHLKNKPVYVNAESHIAKEEASTKDHILYSRKGIENWRVIDAMTDISGTKFTLTNKKDNSSFDISSNLLGLHQIGPLVASFHLALELGLTPEEAIRGIEKTKPFKHRLEPKEWNNGVTFLDDSYNGNPDGVKAVINFLSSLKGGDRFYITPGLVEMGDKTEEVHRDIGRELSEAEVENVVLIRNSVTPFIEKGLEKYNYKGNVSWFNDMPSALKALPHMTTKGDFVLLQNDWPDQYR